MPEPVQDASAKIDEYARGMIAGKRSTLFEELGLYYIGPVDGHNLSGVSASDHTHRAWEARLSVYVYALRKSS